MKLEPLHDRIIVKRVEAATKTAGGIIIPDSAQEKPKEAKVVAVGPGKILEDGSRSTMNVKKGDTVLFTSYAGDEIKVDGEELLIMREDDILVVVG